MAKKYLDLNGLKHYHDSIKNVIDEKTSNLKQKDFVVTITYSVDTTGFTADKTNEEIYQAYQKGLDVVLLNSLSNVKYQLERCTETKAVFTVENLLGFKATTATIENNQVSTSVSYPLATVGEDERGKYTVQAKFDTTDQYIKVPTYPTGVPIGGTAGQILSKKSNTDYDVEWKDAPQGGSSSGGYTETVVKFYKDGGSIKCSMNYAQIYIAMASSNVRAFYSDSIDSPDRKMMCLSHVDMGTSDGGTDRKFGFSYSEVLEDGGVQFITIYINYNDTINLETMMTYPPGIFIINYSNGEYTCNVTSSSIQQYVVMTGSVVGICGTDIYHLSKFDSEAMIAYFECTELTSSGVKVKMLTIDGNDDVGHAEIEIGNTGGTDTGGMGDVIYRIGLSHSEDKGYYIDLDWYTKFLELVSEDMTKIASLYILEETETDLYCYSYSTVEPSDNGGLIVYTDTKIEDNEIKKYDVKIELTTGLVTKNETTIPLSSQVQRIAMTNSDTNITIEPNKLYVWPEMASLAITLATPINNNIANEYHFFFESGATPTNLTLNDVLSDTYTIEANMKYEVSILEGIARIKGFAKSES